LQRTDNEPEDEEATKDSRRRQPHTWSFLHAMATITATQGENLIALPDDFTGVSGDLVIESGKGRLPIVPEAALRALAAKNVNQATPEYAAIRPRKTTEGQRYDLLLYPSPDAEVTLTCRHAVNAEDLSDENPYPFGGRQHAETILASCLAVAEDREEGEQGEAHARFMERLAASIALDKRTEPSEGTVWTSEDESDGNTLLSLAGEHMGFGQDPNGWTGSQRQQVLQVTREGVARFHQAAPIPGRRDSHEWSFLTPLATINLESGVYRYDLPDDFGGFAGLGGSPLTYEAGDNVIYPSITIIGEGQIRRLLQQSVSASGRPVKAAHGRREGQDGYELWLWPVPDDDYVIRGRYRAAPSQDMSVIPGSDAHFLTILESIRAAADVFLKRKHKPHEARFLERLHASVLYDQQLMAPHTLGMNRSQDSRRSGHPYDSEHRAGWGESGVKYNGVLY
jgi:hypothetical protein